MTARCEFTALAAGDLRGIILYTRETWGVPQARRYRQELELTLTKLSLSPLMGLARHEVAPQVRSFLVGSHVAYYLPRKRGITILRLLHVSMDVERAFRRKPADPGDGKRKR